MTQHPRSMPTAKAHNELDKAFIDIIEKYNLTYAEAVNILGQIICSLSKLCVNEERK
jgi:hypothetical protein